MESAYIDKNKAILVVGSIVFAIFIWVWINSPIVITATGVGEVTVPATNATISVTLMATGDNPQAAMENVKQKIDTVSAVLKNKGLAPEDIAKSQITAIPAALAIANGQGFQATATMGAKTKEVANISTLVADLYAAGAAVVSQPILSAENQEVFEQQALDQALKNAKKEAGKMALKNWKLFRKVVAITQASSPTTSTATTRADLETEAKSQQAADNGVFKIIKSVSVVYKLW